MSNLEEAEKLAEEQLALDRNTVKMLPNWITCVDLRKYLYELTVLCNGKPMKITQFLSTDGEVVCNQNIRNSLLVKRELANQLVETPIIVG